MVPPKEVLIHRITEWFGRTLKLISFKPLPWAGTPSIRPRCWQPQLWAPSQGRIAPQCPAQLSPGLCPHTRTSPVAVPREQDGQPEEEDALGPRDPSAAAPSALEDMALYSSRRKLRHSRRSLETAVPT